jgi:hypothetical protein
MNCQSIVERGLALHRKKRIQNVGRKDESDVLFYILDNSETVHAKQLYYLIMKGSVEEALKRLNSHDSKSSSSPQLSVVDRDAIARRYLTLKFGERLRHHSATSKS